MATMIFSSPNQSQVWVPQGRVLKSGDEMLKGEISKLMNVVKALQRDTKDYQNIIKKVNAEHQVRCYAEHLSLNISRTLAALKGDIHIENIKLIVDREVGQAFGSILKDFREEMAWLSIRSLDWVEQIKYIVENVFAKQTAPIQEQDSFDRLTQSAKVISDGDPCWQKLLQVGRLVSNQSRQLNNELTNKTQNIQGLTSIQNIHLTNAFTKPKYQVPIQIDLIQQPEKYIEEIIYEKCDSLSQGSTKDSRIYEVPIEMQLLRETLEAEIQVNIEVRKNFETVHVLEQDQSEQCNLLTKSMVGNSEKLISNGEKSIKIIDLIKQEKMELTKEIEVLVKEIMDLRGAKANYSMLNNLTRMQGASEEQVSRWRQQSTHQLKMNGNTQNNISSCKNVYENATRLLNSIQSEHDILSSLKATPSQTCLKQYNLTQSRRMMRRSSIGFAMQRSNSSNLKLYSNLYDIHIQSYPSPYNKMQSSGLRTTSFTEASNTHRTQTDPIDESYCTRLQQENDRLKKEIYRLNRKADQDTLDCRESSCRGTPRKKQSYEESLQRSNHCQRNDHCHCDGKNHCDRNNHCKRDSSGQRNDLRESQHNVLKRDKSLRSLTETKDEQQNANKDIRDYMQKMDVCESAIAHRHPVDSDMNIGVGLNRVDLGSLANRSQVPAQLKDEDILNLKGANRVQIPYLNIKGNRDGLSESEVSIDSILKTKKAIKTTNSKPSTRRIGDNDNRTSEHSLKYDENNCQQQQNRVAQCFDHMNNDGVPHVIGHGTDSFMKIMQRTEENIEGVRSSKKLQGMSKESIPLSNRNIRDDVGSRTRQRCPNTARDSSLSKNTQRALNSQRSPRVSEVPEMPGQREQLNQLQKKQLDYLVLPTDSCKRIGRVQNMIRGIHFQEEILTDQRKQLMNSARANMEYIAFEHQNESEKSIHDRYIACLEEQQAFNFKSGRRLAVPTQVNEIGSYAVLTDRLYEMEQQKSHLGSMLQNMQFQNEGLKSAMHQMEMQVQRTRHFVQQMSIKHQEELQAKQKEIWALECRSTEYLSNIEGQKMKRMDLQNKLSRFTQLNEKIVDQIEVLKKQKNQLQDAYREEIERINAACQQKMLELEHELKEQRVEQQNFKHSCEATVNQQSRKIISQAKTIEQLEEQIQKQKERFEELRLTHDDLRKTFTQCQANEDQLDTINIYEKEFERVRANFETENSQLANYNIQLKLQNQKIQTQLAQLASRAREILKISEVREKQLKMLKQQNTELHGRLNTLHSEVQSDCKDKILDLTEQLNRLKDCIAEKQQRPYNSFKNDQNQNTKPTHKQKNILQSQKNIQAGHRTSTVGSKLSSAIVEAIEDQDVMPVPKRDKQSKLDNHIKKLQGLALKYQSRMCQAHLMIEELQERAYNYLKYALQKEQEAEQLYVDVNNKEDKINNVLIEKIALQAENRRLSARIRLSEKKLVTMGSRLLEFAHQKHDISQNSSEHEEQY